MTPEERNRQMKWAIALSVTAYAAAAACAVADAYTSTIVALGFAGGAMAGVAGVFYVMREAASVVEDLLSEIDHLERQVAGVKRLN